jgi:glucose uptake protein
MSIKAIVVSIAAGLLIGSFYPLIQISREGELGLGPYAVALIFTSGIFISTLLYNMILMNLPLQGEPLEVVEYFRGSVKTHIFGLAGGMLWCIGMIAYFVSTSAPPYAHIGPTLTVSAMHIATLITTLVGLIVWKEFRGANSKVKGLLALMVLLLGIGLTSVSLSPIQSPEVRDIPIPAESGLPMLPENPPNPVR